MVLSASRLPATAAGCAPCPSGPRAEEEGQSQGHCCAWVMPEPRRERGTRSAGAQPHRGARSMKRRPRRWQLPVLSPQMPQERGRPTARPAGQAETSVTSEPHQARREFSSHLPDTQGPAWRLRPSGAEHLPPAQRWGRGAGGRGGLIPTQGLWGRVRHSRDETVPPVPRPRKHGVVAEPGPGGRPNSWGGS